MYKRASSGLFIALTTAGIVVVMAIFTWVMYGMAQQVYVMTDIMKDLNVAMQTMVVSQSEMAGDIHTMSKDFTIVSTAVDEDMGAMSGNLDQIRVEMTIVTARMDTMTRTIGVMSKDMAMMNMNVSRASYAFANPVSYMFGNSFPF